MNNYVYTKESKPDTLPILIKKYLCKNKVSKFRILTCFLLTVSLQLSAHAFAQKINIQAKNATLENIFKQVREQSGYSVIYKSSYLKEALPVTVSIKNVDINEALKIILNNQPFDYVVKGKMISLKPTAVRPIKSANSSSVADDFQKRPISGFVKDSLGHPLSNATIQVKNKKLNTSTNEKGFFKFENMENESVLIISYIGYQTLEISSSSNLQEIVLIADKQEVGEVVITGIFKRDARNFTGSSTSITGADLKRVSAQNVFAAISAYDPAFRIVPNNIAGGNINRLPNIQMRGQNSFPNLSGELSANPNQPLLILDGFEVNLQRIVDLDMNLIENITLLKDATATSIYGSRGANGVMVVTTKTPQAGRVQVTLNNDFSVSTPDLSVYNMLDAQSKLDFEERIGLYNYPESPQYQHKMDVLHNVRKRAIANGVNTNWLKVPTQVGYNNRTSLLLQGGDETIRFGVQLNSDFQNGVMKGQDRKNYAGQFDLNYFVKSLQFRNSIRLFKNKANESPYGDFSEYVDMNPYWTPLDAQGRSKKLLEYVSVNYTDYEQSNPAYDATLHSVNSSQYFGFSNNFQIRYSPSDVLFIESSLSLNKQNASSDEFYSAEDSRFNIEADPKRKGTYSKRNEDDFSYESLTTANLNYTKGKHQLFSTASVNIQSAENNFYRITAQGFPYDRLDNLLFGAQYEQDGRPTGDESKKRNIGFMYSGSYSYDNRYLLDLSARRDGSSQYGSKKKFGLFWSTGIGWNLHNEKFLSDSEFIDRLKVRVSYGTTGSLNIPSYSAQYRYTFGVDTRYFDELGAMLMGLGNEYLSWQNVYKGNIGIDAQFFKQMLDLRLDYYVENTKNTISQITLAPSTGFDQFSENLGQIQNKGFEFSSRIKILQNADKGLLWAVNVNGFSNNNILKKLSNKLVATNQKQDEANEKQVSPNPIYQEGQSMNTIYAVRSLGIDPTTGSEVFLTKNGEKTFSWQASDKVAVGIGQPKWTGNFGTSFMYKGLDVNLIFNAQFGGQMYNQTLADRVEAVDASKNVDKRAYDLGWTGPGDISSYKRITRIKQETRLTSRFVQDDNNLKLSSAAIGYNFYRSAFLKRTGLRSLHISAITNDLFTMSSIRIERGTSNPFARTYSLSIRAGF